MYPNLIEALCRNKEVTLRALFLEYNQMLSCIQCNKYFFCHYRSLKNITKYYHNLFKLS